MGLAGWSYESQNPPLYYALLAPLQRVSLLVGVSPRTEVIALRLAGVLAFILGCLLLLLGFRELHNRFAVPEVYGVMLAVIALTTQHQTIATLGNDVLSFPFSVATCLFALRTCRAPTWQNRLGLALLAGLAPLVKLTNIPLLALPLIVAMCVRVRDRDATRWWPEASTALATLPTALFLGVSAWRSGKLLGSSVARDAFATFVEPLRPFSEFLGVLTADSFQLQLVGLAGTRWVVSASFGLLFLAALQSVVWLTLRKRRADAIFHLVSVGVVATTIAGSWFLNDRIPGVHWHVFRHYFWCLPFWLFAFLATPLRLTILGTTWIRRGTP